MHDDELLAGYRLARHPKPPVPESLYDAFAHAQPVVGRAVYGENGFEPGRRVRGHIHRLVLNVVKPKLHVLKCPVLAGMRARFDAGIARGHYDGRRGSFFRNESNGGLNERSCSVDDPGLLLAGFYLDNINHVTAFDGYTNRAALGLFDECDFGAVTGLESCARRESRAPRSSVALSNPPTIRCRCMGGGTPIELNRNAVPEDDTVSRLEHQVLDPFSGAGANREMGQRRTGLPLEEPAPLSYVFNA